MNVGAAAGSATVSRAAWVGTLSVSDISDFDTSKCVTPVTEGDFWSLGSREVITSGLGRKHIRTDGECWDYTKNKKDLNYIGLYHLKTM